MRKIPTWRPWFAAAVSLFFLSCASDYDQNVENALFALDKADYAAAEGYARAAVADKPDSAEAKFLLGTALLGGSVLGGDYKTYLGFLVAVKRDKEPGESNMETFGRVSEPMSTERLAKLHEARDTFLSIDVSDRNTNVYLQLYVARLFEITAVTRLLGAAPGDKKCLNPAGLSGAGNEENERFQENLNDIDGDRNNAHLPDDFALNTRLTEMGSDLDAAILANGGDVDLGAEAFYTAEFGATDGDC